MSALTASYLVELALHQLWQGVALAAVGAVLMKLRPKWSAESRHALWVAILIAVAALPLLALLPRSETLRPLQLPVLLIEPARSAGSGTAVAVAPAMEHGGTAFESISGIALSVWLAGALWKLSALLRATRALRRWRRAAIPVRIEWLPAGEVRESRDVSVPMVIGILRPCILLPEGLKDRLSASQLKLVLLHELAHVHRGDVRWVLVQRLIEAVYFYNPVVLWISRQIARERECSCDDRALRLAKGSNVEYADCLVEVTRHIIQPEVSALAVGAMRRSSELRHRVERLLHRMDGAETRASWASVGVAVCALVAIAVATSLGVPRFAEAQAPTQGKRGGAIDPHGRSLVEAVNDDDVAAATALIDAGADVNYALAGDGTATIVAARRGNLRMVQFLIARGADPDGASAGDGNPLIVAAARGDMPIVNELVQRGANVNAYVPHDETPLINASRQGHLEVVRYLIDRGADVNLAVEAMTRNGVELRSPLGEARKHARKEVERHLQQHGARS